MTRQAKGHHGEKPGETLVRFIVEQTLGERVCSYDDRRGTSRVDAIIHRLGGAPLEIVSDPWVAGNQQSAALAKKARGLTITGLRSGYKILLTAEARVDSLGWVESTLRDLDDPVTRALVPHRTKDYDSIVAWPALKPGQIIFSTGGGGGRARYTAADVVTSVVDTLASPKYADVERKLSAHGGPERHAVVVVDEDQTAASAWLRRGGLEDLAQLPEPDLGEEITHLWITPRIPQGLTIRWSPQQGWSGTHWRWGTPEDALAAWDDPVCPIDHDAALLQ